MMKNYIDNRPTTLAMCEEIFYALGPLTDNNSVHTSEQIASEICILFLKNKRAEFEHQISLMKYYIITLENSTNNTNFWDSGAITAYNGRKRYYEESIQEIDMEIMKLKNEKR